MGKNIRNQESSNIPLQNGNSNCVNKLLHALNRRHRWHNVRKVLPNKRQGSGKHIIDGGTNEPIASTSQSPEGHKDPKNDKPQNEQASTESSSVSSKSSKKFRIRSLISDEMSKRRGKHRRRRSGSPTRSPHKQSSAKQNLGSGMNEKPQTSVTQGGCQSPSTIKKRKCDICAAMLTVSYLRQQGLENENRKLSVVEENINNNQQPSSLEMGHAPLHPRIGLTKSFSVPLLGTTRRRDFEVEELKQKLRDCKDIETAKEKFILPMNLWNDTLFPKPMLTRPASFRNPPSSSQKENKQAAPNPKSLKQKLGFAMKDSRKEKRRILMDAVFHKIPYGRRSSKDPKRVEPEKIKSNSTSSSGSDHPSGDKSHFKRTSTTNEAMGKYRRLLSQTSTRDERCQHGDHKPRLCVAEEHPFGMGDRRTVKRIRSLPNISPYDFKDNQEFPVKKTHMDIHPSTIASEIFDEQKSADYFVFADKRNVSTAAKENLAKETKSVIKNPATDRNTSDHQEKIENQKEFADKETKLSDKEEADDKNEEVDLNTFDHPENIEHEKESSDGNETAAKKTKLVDENPGLGLDNFNHQEKINNEKETKIVEKDEDPKGGLNSSDHQENVVNQKESPGEKDKSFNEILGMFKKVSDERVKVDPEKHPIVVVRKVGKDSAIKNNDPAGVDKNRESVGQNTLDTLQEEKPPLKTGSEVEYSKQDSVLDSSSPINSPSENFSEQNQYQRFSFSDPQSIDDKQHDIDEPMDISSTDDRMMENEVLHFDDKQHNNNQPMDISSTDDRMTETRFLHLDDKKHNNDQPMYTSSTDDQMVEKRSSLHLDLESVKDNAEFQFVKEVLERSGFLENELLGEWYSSYHPIDPLLFEEVETNFLQTKNFEELDSMKDEEAAHKIINDHHLLLFDLINEALLEIHNRTFTYCPHPLIYCSKVRPTPVGWRILEEVWDIVNMYLSLKPELQPSLDDVVSRDLAKGGGWMNLQADAEFVGIELEEMLADDLLDELVFDDLLM